MRIPVRSEGEAFRLVVGLVLVLAAALLIGWLVAVWAGLAVLLIACAVAAIGYVRAPNPDRHTPLRDAARAPHPSGGGTGDRHVLVVANEALSGADLRERILRGHAGRTEVDILVPVLAPRRHYAVSDIDHEVEDARGRLERSLAWAHEQGLVARGEVGDPSPATAMADELRDFGADEVIVVTHPSERETWQEQGELERLRAELEVPVTHFVLGDLDAPAEFGA